MPETNVKTKRPKNKRLLRTLLLVALGLALVITIQIGVVYYEGTQAGNNANLLLSAFRENAESKVPAPSASPEAAGSTPGAAQQAGTDAAGSAAEGEGELPAEPEVVISESDVTSAASADEHRLEDDSSGVDESGEYVQPDMPTVSERDKIIAEVTEKVGEDGIIGIIEIPEIDIELPIIGKWSYKLLKISVCRYKGPAANEKGNLVVIGHNYKNGSHFGNLSKLSVGSEIFLTDLNSQKVRYVVNEIKTIAPTAFSALDKYEGDCGLTLVTCINNGSNRQIFRCKQEAK